jgi:hypothetical protein
LNIHQNPHILNIMLTNHDLSQIQKIVHTEIQSETRKIVREELKPIKKDINLIVRSFDRDYVALRKRVERLETHPSPLFTHA